MNQSIWENRKRFVNNIAISDMGIVLQRVEEGGVRGPTYGM